MKKSVFFGVTALLMVAMGASLVFAATPSQPGMQQMMTQEQMKEQMSNHGEDAGNGDTVCAGTPDMNNMMNNGGNMPGNKMQTLNDGSVMCKDTPAMNGANRMNNKVSAVNDKSASINMHEK